MAQKKRSAKKKTETYTAILHWIDVAIWRRTVLFSVGYESLPALVERLKKTWPKKLGECEWVVGLEDGKTIIEERCWYGLRRWWSDPAKNENHDLYYIIIPKEFNFSDDHMCKLAHECLHVAQFMVEQMSDVSREFEAFAYTHTYIMEQCLKVLRENQ